MLAGTSKPATVHVLLELIVAGEAFPDLREPAAAVSGMDGAGASAVHATSGPLAKVLMGSTHDVAYGIVALYLGLEVLNELDGDTAAAERLVPRLGVPGDSLSAGVGVLSKLPRPALRSMTAE